jgi:hypothetical protein
MSSQIRDLKMVLVATSDDISKYANRTCDQARDAFYKEFVLTEKSFVDYLLYYVSDGTPEIQVSSRHKVLTAKDYGTESSLDCMVEKYLYEKIPYTGLKFFMFPLVIVNSQSKEAVLKAFAKQGHTYHLDLDRIQDFKERNKLDGL